MMTKKVQELERSLGLEMPSIRDMDAKIQALSINQPRVDAKTAPIVLMEDNLTKAKRALMAPKQLCPSGLNIQSIERKAHKGERDESILTKLIEMMTRKSREYLMLFSKYSRDSKQGHVWCANICYHAILQGVPRNIRHVEFSGIF